MNDKRREADRNFFKAFWEWATPWGQILIFVITCAFVIGDKSSKYDAYAATLAEHATTLAVYDRRLTNLENSSIQTNQMVKDMVYYFKVPHKEAP